MLGGIKEVNGYTVLATDGTIGYVQDFYFDAQAWAIRYLVVDTQMGQSSRRVFLSPTVLGQLQRETKTLPVSLSQRQVKHSPHGDTNQPLSRQQEIELYTYYNWPPYWEVTAPIPNVLVPPDLSPDEDEAGVGEKYLLEKSPGDLSLHGISEVIGYYVQARDGDIGHIENFLIDDETWTIQYVIVDINNWLPGKKVQLAPHWFKTISWNESTIYADLQRETIKNSPEYEIEPQS